MRETLSLSIELNIFAALSLPFPFFFFFFFFTLLRICIVPDLVFIAIGYELGVPHDEAMIFYT